MNHYILTIDFHGLELWGIYCNKTDELIAAFASSSEARKYMYSFYKV